MPWVTRGFWNPGIDRSIRPNFNRAQLYRYLPGSQFLESLVFHDSRWNTKFGIELSSSRLEIRSAERRARFVFFIIFLLYFPLLFFFFIKYQARVFVPFFFIFWSRSLKLFSKSWSIVLPRDRDFWICLRTSFFFLITIIFTINVRECKKIQTSFSFLSFFLVIFFFSHDITSHTTYIYAYEHAKRKRDGYESFV